MSARKTRNEIITTSFWRINSRFSRWSTYLHLRGIQWVEIIYDEVVLLLLLLTWMFIYFLSSYLMIALKLRNKTYALSFYGSKIILDLPNDFGRVPIIFDGSNSFGSGPNHFGQVQIIKISSEKSDLNLTKMIWTWPKQFIPIQNNLDGPKSFLTYRIGWTWSERITTKF